MKIDIFKKRYRLRVVIPASPSITIYSRSLRKMTALGPVCIATAANKMEKWDVEIIDENNYSRYGPQDKSGLPDHKRLQILRPADVIGFYGGLTSTIPRLYELARFYKYCGAITIAGGQHFTEETIPEALSSGIDCIVIGEGEETIKEFLLAMEGKGDIADIRGIAYLKNKEVIYTPPREPITDFDLFPLPDFSLMRYARVKVYPVGRIRGCGMNCEFCAVKGKVRCGSPERLLEHIRLLVETRNARHFFIVDDFFGQQRKETIRFCNMLREYQKEIHRRVSIMVQMRLDSAKDDELLTAMRGAGIDKVAIGFESVIDEELRAMRKKVRTEDMLSMTKAFHKFGFFVHGMFIFGYPVREDVNFKMSARERTEHLRRFIKKARIDTLQVLLPIPLPGTELRERLKAQGRIYPTEHIGWEYYDGYFPLFEPDEPMTPEEMLSCLRKIMGSFYRFRYMFSVALNIFYFPSLLFSLHNIKSGWRVWYRPWRNSVMRFGGWIAEHAWRSKFKKEDFFHKLKQVKKPALQKMN